MTGTLIISGSNVFKLALQFGVLPVLARFLTPSDYGVVGMAIPLVFFANIFGDGGASTAILRGNGRSSAALESTVFWVSTGISTGLALLVAAVAIPFSYIMRQPLAAPVLFALAPMLVLSGMSSAANAKVLRERRLGVFAISDIASSVLAAGCAVTLAILGAGAWSLVAQQLVLWSVRLMVLLLRGGARIRLECDLRLLAGTWNFGVSIAGSKTLDFISRNVDNLIIGAFLGAAMLGRYSIAYQMMRLPELVVAGPLFVALFPSLMGLVKDQNALRGFFKAALSVVAATLLPVFCGLVLVADLALPALLGEKWRGAAPVLVVLAPAGTLFSLFALFGAVMFSRGQGAIQLQMALWIALATAIGVAIGSRFGIVAAAAGISLAMVSAAPLYLRRVCVEVACTLSDLGACLASPAAGCLAMAAAVLILRWRCSGAAPIVLLVGCGALGAVSYASVVWLLSRRSLMEQILLLRGGAGGRMADR